MKTYPTTIYKCKKCGRTIEDIENAKIDKDIHEEVIVEFPSYSWLIYQGYKRRKQEKYNQKYGTRNVLYKFGICKDCI